MSLIQRARSIIFGGKDKEPMYNFIDRTVDQLNVYSDGLDQLSRRKVDGFMIRNAFNENEVQALLKVFLNQTDDRVMKADGGLRVFPEPFSYASQFDKGSSDFEEYFLRCEQIWKHLENDTGIDFSGRLKEIVGRLAKGKEIRIPPNPSGDGGFSPGNYRSLIPGHGSFKPHCGNYFHNEFPHIYELIREFSNPINQFSYFLCLRKPTVGGELMLYDVEWKDAKIRLQGDTVLQTENQEKIDLRKPGIRKQAIKPEVGDIVLFSGGEIWHEVMTIPENEERITLGGFVTRGHDNESYYIWS